MAITYCSIRRYAIGAAAVTAVAALALALSSCDRSGEIRFEKATIKVKGNVLRVELARTREQQMRGLQERKSMGEGEGMLFIDAAPREQVFWMDKTLIPLSIAFVDDAGVIRQIEDMEPMTQTNHVSKDEVTYALEVNKGWFQRHTVKVGDWVDLSGVPAK